MGLLFSIGGKAHVEEERGKAEKRIGKKRKRVEGNMVRTVSRVETALIKGSSLADLAQKPKRREKRGENVGTSIRFAYRKD